MEVNNLTDKQRRFCEEYVLDWNATRAAIAAGYSEKTAKEIGCQNLTKVNIKKYVDQCRNDTARLAGVSALSNVKVLTEIIGGHDISIRDKIKAIEVLNKMLGMNAPDKKDITTQGEKINIPAFKFAEK